jgi:hypothetical protein
MQKSTHLDFLSLAIAPDERITHSNAPMLANLGCQFHERARQTAAVHLTIDRCVMAITG